jgi:hypothetical protein
LGVVTSLLGLRGGSPPIRRVQEGFDLQYVVQILRRVNA